MKKFCPLIFIALAARGYVFAQTWTESRSLDGRTGNKTQVFIFDYTIITREEFDAILHFRTDNGAYAKLLYEDSFSLSRDRKRTSSGLSRWSNLRGDQYGLAKMSLSTNGKNLTLSSDSGLGMAICYGNSKTGRLEIIFCNPTAFSEGVYLLNSDTFKRIYNRMVRAVNGE